MSSPLDLINRPSPQKSHALWLPGGLIAIILVITFLAPWLAPYDPLRIVGDAYQAPSGTYLLGTDSLGRDVLSRALWGGRQTLSVAILALIIAIVPGLALGVLACCHRQWVERLVLAAIDVLLAFPGLLLALVIITVAGTGSVQVATATGIAALPTFTRTIRTSIREISAKPYIEAAKAIGLRQDQILLHYIWPNILDMVLSLIAIVFSWAILGGAALAFLGLSGDPSIPDWGVMLNEGRYAFRVAPWISIPPGIAITCSVFAINQFADYWEKQISAEAS